MTVRFSHWCLGGRSGADIGPGTHTLVVTVTETLAPVSNTTLLSEEFGLGRMNFAIYTARFARLVRMRVVWLITNVLRFGTIARVMIVTLAGAWQSPVSEGQSKL